MISITEATEKDLDQLGTLSKLLWTNETIEGLTITFKETLYRPHEVTFVAKADHKAVGLSIFSIRSEYVEGAQGTPTGYLEAIVVDEAHSSKGIAQLLLEKGTEWCKTRGCTQLGSDVEIDNSISQSFHLKQGFHEVNRLVCYIKQI